VQWIEIENRAMRFLDDYQKHQDCFTMHSPHDLRSPERVAELIQFFGLEQTNPEIVIKGNQNRTPGARTVIGETEQQQFRDVVEALPAQYLEIFTRAPYAEFDWVDLLRK